jgi:hypothetical protein
VWPKINLNLSAKNQSQILRWRNNREDVALAIVVRPAHLVHQDATVVMVLTVHQAHPVNVVTQLHPIAPSSTTSPNNAHAKLRPVMLDQLVLKVPMDQPEMPALREVMANQANKDRKVRQAKMEKPVPMVKKARAVMLVKLRRKLDPPVPQVVKEEMVPLVHPVNRVQPVKMVNQAVLVLRVNLVQPVRMENQVQRVQMVTLANKVTLVHATIAHQLVWLQDIKVDENFKNPQKIVTASIIMIMFIYLKF